MAIIGIGLDLAAVDRVRKLLAGPLGKRFVERVFTPAERAFCDARLERAEAYAARFAAKEALVKALGAPKGIRWTDIEVAREEQKAPVLKLRGRAAEEVRKRKAKVFLSLTHDGGVAAATVVLEK